MCRPNTPIITKVVSHGHARSNHRLRISSQQVLKAIYVATCASCAFMVVWILIFPSSWLVGHSEFHTYVIHKTIVEPYDGTSISPRVVTKYGGHPAIQFSHILPGALWAAAIPFQIHPGFRKSYKKLHRQIGYAFVSSSIIMMMGLFLIVKRNLTYDNDYPEAPPVSVFDKMTTTVTIAGLSGWFIFTAVMAAIKARSKNFEAHKHYIYRHIASGLWVAIQRVVVILNGKQENAIRMRDSFGTAASIGFSISMVIGEVAVYLDRRRGKTIKAS